MPLEPQVFAVPPQIHRYTPQTDAVSDSWNLCCCDDDSCHPQPVLMLQHLPIQTTQNNTFTAKQSSMTESFRLSVSQWSVVLNRAQSRHSLITKSTWKTNVTRTSFCQRQTTHACVFRYQCISKSMSLTLKPNSGIIKIKLPTKSKVCRSCKSYDLETHRIERTDRRD